MLFLKTILIFLIIFINKIIKARYPFVYSVGISGKLKCSLRITRSNSALVIISKNPYIYVETNPIVQSYFSFHRFFNLLGHVKIFKTRRRPTLYLKIIHTCYKFGSSRKRMYVVQIPSSYVNKGYGITRLFYLGNADLAYMQGQSLYGSIRNSLKE